MEDRILDARGLMPPEPMELTLDAIETLGPGERLRLLIHRDPQMLYPILEEWGYSCLKRTVEDGTFEILIWRSQDEPTAGK